MLIAGSMVSDSDDIERVTFLPLLLLVVGIVTSGRNRAARSCNFADNHDRYFGYRWPITEPGTRDFDDFRRSFVRRHFPLFERGAS